jgi:hypothetical protein
MDVPNNIEIEIVDYLNVEYGVYEEEKKYKTSDLEFEGKFLLDGKIKLFWKFPCSSVQGCWATVEEYESSYLISMTTRKPSSQK